MAFLIIWMSSQPAQAAATVGFCQNQPSCICVDWDREGGSYIQVICPSANDSGWTLDPGGANPQPPSPWGGDGSDKPASSPHPGNLLSGMAKQAWDRAHTTALNKLRGECYQFGGRPVCIPDECGRMFQGNLLGRKGADILENYVIARGGEGVKDSKGNTPCNSAATSAWTNCCGHSRYVFVCDRFTNLTSNNAVMIQIHEALHVAGFPEDHSTSIGPGDPPTTNQINDAVRSACGL